MTAEDWMIRGYSDGRAGIHSPPNFPLYQQAYEHGQQSARDDRSPGKGLDYFKERRAAAEAIIAADVV